MVKNLAGAEIGTHGLSTHFVLCQLRLYFGALQPPSVQPTYALSSGQYSGGPLQLGAVADKLSGTQSRFSQSLYALKE